LSAPKHPCSNRIQRIRNAVYSGQASSQVSCKVCCQPSMAAKLPVGTRTRFPVPDLVKRLCDRDGQAGREERRHRYAEVVGGIGFVYKAWRRLVKHVLIPRRRIGFVACIGCNLGGGLLPSFPRCPEVRSHRVVGNARAGHIAAVVGPGSLIEPSATGRLSACALRASPSVKSCAMLCRCRRLMA
jgi:hypothetical protein